jgi:hypothetical protein
MRRQPTSRRLARASSCRRSLPCNIPGIGRFPRGQDGHLELKIDFERVRLDHGTVAWVRPGQFLLILRRRARGSTRSYPSSTRAVFTLFRNEVEQRFATTRVEDYERIIGYSSNTLSRA